MEFSNRGVKTTVQKEGRVELADIKSEFGCQLLHFRAIRDALLDRQKWSARSLIRLQRRIHG
jgi:hypothetical protein